MIELVKELIEGGFVGQAIIASLTTIGIIVLAVQQKPIPEFLAVGWGMVIAWFFRSQAQIIADRKAHRANVKVLRAAITEHQEGKDKTQRP